MTSSKRRLEIAVELMTATLQGCGLDVRHAGERARNITQYLELTRDENRLRGIWELLDWTDKERPGVALNIRASAVSDCYRNWMESARIERDEQEQAR